MGNTLIHVKTQEIYFVDSADAAIEKIKEIFHIE